MYDWLHAFIYSGLFVKLFLDIVPLLFSKDAFKHAIKY